MLAIDYKILQPILPQNFEQISDGDVHFYRLFGDVYHDDFYGCMFHVLCAEYIIFVFQDTCLKGFTIMAQKRNRVKCPTWEIYFIQLLSVAHFGVHCTIVLLLMLSCKTYTTHMYMVMCS